MTQGWVIAAAVCSVGLALPAPAAGFGSWSPLSPLGPVGARDAQVGVADSGDAVAAWTTRDSSRGRVEVAYKPPGGAFGGRHVVSGPVGLDSELEQLLVNPRGDAVVLFQQEEFVMAAYRPAGAAFGQTEVVSGAGATFADAAIDTAGTVTALLLGEDGELLATQRQVSGGFAEPSLIDQGPVRFAFVAADAPGNLVAGYGASDGVFVSERAAGGDWGAPTRLSEPATTYYGETARPAALTVGAQGDAVLAWLADRDSGSRDVVVSLRPAGGAFGEPLVLSPPGESSAALGPPVVDADVEGNIVVAWARFDRAAGPGIALARRPAGGTFAEVERVPGTQTGVTPLIRIGRDGRLMVLWAGARGMMFSEFVADVWSMPPSRVSDPGWSQYSAAFDPSNAGVVVAHPYGSAQAVYSAFDPNRERSFAELTDATLSRGRVLARDRGPILTLTTTADTGIRIDIENLEDPYLAVKIYRRARQGSSSFRIPTRYKSLGGGWEPRGGWLPPGRYRIRIRPTGPGVAKGRVVLRLRIAPEHLRTR